MALAENLDRPAVAVKTPESRPPRQARPVPNHLRRSIAEVHDDVQRRHPVIIAELAR